MPLAWTAGTYATAGKMNASSLHQMTGDELLDLSADVKSPGMKVYITQDSTDLVYRAGNYYTLSNDLGTWTKDGLALHSHIDTDNGGRLSDTVLIPNIPTTIDLDKRYAKSNDFWTTTASGGSVTDDATNGRIVLDTSASSSGIASISDGGARSLNFAYPSAFEITIQQSSATNFKSKMGVNAESIQDANTNTVKYGMEGCSTSGTVWLVFSADGTTRSTVATASPVVTGAPTVYLVEHTPASTVTLSINGVEVVSKSSNIPSTGLSALNNIYKAGIQNTTAEQKILYHYGGPRLVGGI